MISFNDIGPGLMRALFEGRSSGVTSRFSNGETIQGLVTKTLSPQSAIIRLRGLDLTATTLRPLTEGQPILVKVEQLSPQFVVSLLPNETPAQEKTAALLRMYLPSASPLDAIIGELDKLLPNLPSGALRGSGLEKILDEIRATAKTPGGNSGNSFQLIGLSHESELAKGAPTQNLKRALLTVRQNLERQMQKEPRSAGEGLKKVDVALSNIELRQLMNIPKDQGVTSWPLLYWNGEGLDTARLYVGRDRREKGKNRKNDTVRLTLMLKMSRLGNIRAEAIAFKDKIEGALYAESDTTVQSLEASMTDFKKTLRNLGFTANFTVQRASRDFLTRTVETDTVLPVKNLLNLQA